MDERSHTGELTPAWRRWSEMAAAQVIRHMDGAPLVPVSYAFAAQSAQRQEDASSRTERRPHRKAVPTEIETLVIEGVNSGLSDASIGRIIGASSADVEEMVRRLENRNLVRDGR